MRAEAKEFIPQDELKQHDNKADYDANSGDVKQASGTDRSRKHAIASMVEHKTEHAEEHKIGHDIRESQIGQEVGEHMIGEHVLGERMFKAYGAMGGDVKQTCSVCWCGTTVYAPLMMPELTNTQLLEARKNDETSTQDFKMLEESLKDSMKYKTQDHSPINPEEKLPNPEAEQVNMKAKKAWMAETAKNAKMAAVAKQAQMAEEAREDRMAMKATAAQENTKAEEATDADMQNAEISMHKQAEIVIHMTDTFGNKGTYTGPPTVSFSNLVRRHFKHFGVKGTFKVNIEADGIRGQEHFDGQSTLMACGIKTGSRVTLHVTAVHPESEPVSEVPRASAARASASAS